jgi:hypothetical protein
LFQQSELPEKVEEAFLPETWLCLLTVPQIWLVLQA